MIKAVKNFANKTKENNENMFIILSGLLNKIKAKPLYIIVIPWVAYAFYLIAFASPQFESQSQIIVKSSDKASSFDASALLGSAVSGAGYSNDSQLIEAFVKSTDMLDYLNKTIQISEHYSLPDADVFSRLNSDHTREGLLKYYLDHVEVEVDSTSSIITLKTRAFSADYATLINQTIVEHAENFINNIGNNLAKSQLAFAQSEHDIVEQKLQEAKLGILEFQSKYNVLDPTAEGAAFQQIAFSLEATLAQKKAELNTLRSMMSETAPEVLTAKRQIKALEEQIESQKSRVSDKSQGEHSLSVSEQMAQYSNLKVQLELAIQAFSSSLMTLENTRVETYQQLQHLVTIESPTHPEDNKYPEVIYNLVLVGVVLFMLFAIIRIIIATIREL